MGASACWASAVPKRRPSPRGKIALLESFADQAVIAIENVRLFNETKEALERQTASNDILKVMAASPGDVQPVFDAIVADAQRLTGATTCHVHRVDGEWLQLAAFSASDEASAAALKRMFPLRIADFAAAAQLRAGQPQLVADAETDERFNATIRAAMRARGVRSSAIVPLMRGGEWYRRHRRRRSRRSRYTQARPAARLCRPGGDRHPECGSSTRPRKPGSARRPAPRCRASSAVRWPMRSLVFEEHPRQHVAPAAGWTGYWLVLGDDRLDPLARGPG